MRTLVFVLLVSVFSSHAIACRGGNDNFDFGGYGEVLSFGKSTSLKERELILDMSFVDELIQTPTGSQLQNNRNELFYLIASGDRKALHAGIKVFLQLLKNPEYITECDSKHELWNKEEVAFVVSRSFKIHDALCEFDKMEWDLIVDFFEKKPDLWGVKYDPPWIDREVYICESHK